MVFPLEELAVFVVLLPQAEPMRSKTTATNSMGLRDNFKAGVFLEGFRDMDAFRGLVIFEQGGHDSGQGEGAAVEGVDELDVAVFVFETEL